MTKFAETLQKKIKMKKNALARGFISIKILIAISRKSRKYADDRSVSTYQALMIKFKNYLRYSFNLAAQIKYQGFLALNDPKMPYRMGSLKNYCRMLESQRREQLR